MTLKCSRCDNTVFVVGKVTHVEADDEEFGWHLVEALDPKFFQPATPLIAIPSKTPAGVVEEISGASSLFWSSPPSAANRLRVALERLMDDRKIPRKQKSSKKKLVELSLHARIEKYSLKNTEVGAKLLAIKWIGNSGSHIAKLTSTDVLDGFELLAHALEEIYDSKSTRLKKLADSINKKRGPRKKKKPAGP